MPNYVVTFSGSKYNDTTRRIVEDSPKFGADGVYVYDDYWLEHHRPEFWERMEWFRKRNNKKEGAPRGVMWFAFKPFYILDAFSRIKPGDVILAVDADTYPVADLRPLFQQCRDDGGAMLFNARGCVNIAWTKRDLFTLMGCDTPEYHNAWQAVARFMLFQKGGTFPAEEFLGQWLGFTANPIGNTLEPSILGNPEYPEFREHRAEQSVLSNLAVRYGMTRLYREACEFGGWGTPAILERERDLPHQFFSQCGAHSFDPGGHVEGSLFRNVNS